MNVWCDDLQQQVLQVPIKASDNGGVETVTAMCEEVEARVRLGEIVCTISRYGHGKRDEGKRRVVVGRSKWIREEHERIP